MRLGSSFWSGGFQEAPLGPSFLQADIRTLFKKDSKIFTLPFEKSKWWHAFYDT